MYNNDVYICYIYINMYIHINLCIYIHVDINDNDKSFDNDEDNDNDNNSNDNDITTDWAIEKHDIKVEDKKNSELNLKLKNEKKIEDLRKFENNLKIEKEKKILKDDHDISQNVLRIMRKGGDIEAVNVMEKGMYLYICFFFFEDIYIQIYM
jgi:hypothetical protein